jgi:cell division protein ZapE
MTPAMANEARRLTLLIDTLYDEQVKLVCSAAAEPDRLYATGENSDSFRRAASRLVEMRSAEYLALPHGVHAIMQMRQDD